MNPLSQKLWCLCLNSLQISEVCKNSRGDKLTFVESLQSNTGASYHLSVPNSSFVKEGVETKTVISNRNWNKILNIL